MVTTNNNNRGQILVLVAISLVVLLGFAALAIDIGYFYHTKNQLQGAADPAALAGAAALVDKNDFAQPAARTAAVNYALKNTAAGSPVQVSDGYSSYGNTLSLKNLNPGNDITVGNWDITQKPPYDTTKTPVNAMQVRARRTVGSPGGGVNRFFGQILPGVSAQQDILPTATALKILPLNTPALALCIKSCSTGSTTTFFDLSTNTSTTYSIAWTTFQNVNKVSANDIKDFVNGTSTMDMNELCLAPPCAYTNTGVTASNNLLGDNFRNPAFDTNNKTIVANVVTEWRVAIAIVGYNCNNGPSDPTQGCPPSKQGGKNEPYFITGWAKATITRVCDNTDNKGLCKSVNGIFISNLQCVNCGSGDIYGALGERIKARLLQ